MYIDFYRIWRDTILLDALGHIYSSMARERE
jgi:hypothetical protein